MLNWRRLKNQTSLVLGVSILYFLAGCGEDVQSVSPVNTCSTPNLVGDPWVPNISGAGEANHTDTDASTGVKLFPISYATCSSDSSSTSCSGTLRALTQGYDVNTAQVVSVNIDMSDDLLEKGSFSLVAEVTDLPTNFGASVKTWPVLISLKDSSQKEFVNLTGCTNGFISSCSSSGCTYVTGCGPDTPSAFIGNSLSDRRRTWGMQQKIGTSDTVSVNTFPTCNWANSGNLDCAFDPNNTNGFLADGKLRTGQYTAQYVMLTNAVFSETYSANLRVAVVRKRDGNHGSGSNGAMDLNVVLVGTKNIEDSRTAKGKQNLDALFTHVYNHYYTQNSSSVGVKIGKINVYEWDCPNGGDNYANVDVDSTDAMFKVGSALLPSSTEGKAINVFLVSTIPYSGSMTILGMAGGIVGSMVNGTVSSGVVFSTFDELATYNPSCSSSGTCAISSQERAFIDMGSTVSHEIGHFLGLYHPSESGGTTHDNLNDTPTCTTTQSVNGSSMITIGTCLTETACSTSCGTYSSSGTYCPTKPECQFNHVMWWTSKNYNSSGQGDGNLFSTNSGVIINYSPYVQ